MNIATLKPAEPDTILIGDSATKHVSDKDWNWDHGWHICPWANSVLASYLIYASKWQEDHHSCWVFWIFAKENRLLGSENKTLPGSWTEWRSQHVLISDHIPTLGKGIESFSRRFALNTWLISACLAQGIKFIDKFIIFCNCQDHFKPDGGHPNITGCRLLGANLRHTYDMAYQNMHTQINAKASTHR